jgi:hypothetical protein
MRLCAVLAVMLVALVVVTVRGLRRPHKHPAAPPPDVTEVAVPAVPTAAASAPAPPARREGAGGIARLHGRVLFPPNVGRTSNLEVVAEDPARRVFAQIRDDGRFDVHLPSGRYTLIATMGDLVGVVPDVLARGDAAHDVDIRLGPGATIRGKLRSASANVLLNAVPQGRDEEAGEPLVENDNFSVDGLIAGRRYDLTFYGAGLRTLTLTGVTAPADGLDVELQARARVAGAIGFPRGERCPITHVELRSAGQTGGGDDDDASADVGRDCGFALSVPDQAAEVTVVATGKGWYLEERVVIPPEGDPPPICLNPPCRSDPGAGRARLRLSLEGSPDLSLITAHVTPTEERPEGSAYHSCSSSASHCDIEDLDAGETFSITASGSNCRSDSMTVTLVAGDNLVRIPCLRERRIEGVIRIPEDRQPDRVVVRCAGGDLHPLTRTRLFRLTCGADVGALEYQIGTEGTWRSVPIASLGDPAFVDIGSF